MAVGGMGEKEGMEENREFSPRRSDKTFAFLEETWLILPWEFAQGVFFLIIIFPPYRSLIPPI